MKPIPATTHGTTTTVTNNRWKLTQLWQNRFKIKCFAHYCVAFRPKLVTVVTLRHAPASHLHRKDAQTINRNIIFALGRVHMSGLKEEPDIKYTRK